MILTLNSFEVRHMILAKRLFQMIPDYINKAYVKITSL